MLNLLQDLRYAARRLVRSPGFTLAAVLTLALGIGANTTMFSLLNSVLLRPPAGVAEPGRLVSLYTSDFSGPLFGGSSYADVRDVGREEGTFAGVAGSQLQPVGIGEGEAVQRAGMELVSGNYFRVLGVRPRLGRFFTAEEGGTPGADAVAVISHHLWTTRFNADPRVVGRTLTLAGRPFTIVGVAPEGFNGRIRGVGVDVWVPMTAPRPVGVSTDNLENRGARMLMVVARLRDGVTMEQAQARLDVVARRLHASYPEAWTDLHRKGRKLTAVSEMASRVPPMVRGPVLGFIAMLTVTVGVVLLICCANVAGLMLARATGRAREIGIRASLGASRARIVAQLLTESVLLSALGGGLALLFTYTAADLMRGFQPPIPIPVRLVIDLTPDARVLAFTAAVACFTGVLFGLVPALRVSRPDLTTVLKHDATSLRARRRLTLRGALVVGQVAMSTLLLAGALLFLRSLQHAGSMDPGFRAEGLTMVGVEPLPGKEETVDRSVTPLALRERLAALPGVESVSWANNPPLGLDAASRRGTTVEGYHPAEGEDMEQYFNVVGPGYFRTMGIPLVRGRDFGPGDRRGAPGVVVVNESFARRFWPGQEALGKHVSFSGRNGPWLEVIGVARDSKYLSLGESPRPFVYSAALQDPNWGTVFLVRTAQGQEAVAGMVRREVASLTPDWTVGQVASMQQHIGGALLPQRIAGTVLGLFGALAVLLASVGLYGVVAFAVAQRTREIGIRIALGAHVVEVVRYVLRQGFTLVAAGLGIGLPLAWAVTRLLGSFLVGVSASDPVALVAAPTILVATALLASYLPARRAARVDPMVALRSE